MDTRLLSTFVTLARTGNFTATAAELHLAQSTVTAHIQVLERELRVCLFDRLPAGATLTEAGRQTLEHANRVLEAETGLRAVGGPQDVVEGAVTVGATESLCGYLLPNVVAELHRRHPAVEVELVPVGTADAVEWLLAGRLSLALLIEPAIMAPDLVVEPIADVALTFVTARGHPLADVTATWPELAAQRWFLLEEGCTYSDDVARAVRAVAGSHSRLTRLGSVEATRACAAAGLGPTVLPDFAVGQDVTDGRLATFAGPEMPAQSIFLARHPKRVLGRAARAVADELTRGARSLTAAPNPTPAN